MDADSTIPLAVGENVITIEVTAQDGATTRTYTVTVTRADPAQDATAARPDGIDAQSPVLPRRRGVHRQRFERREFG